MDQQHHLPGVPHGVEDHFIREGASSEVKSFLFLSGVLLHRPCNITNPPSDHLLDVAQLEKLNSGSTRRISDIACPSPRGKKPSRRQGNLPK